MIRNTVNNEPLDVLERRNTTIRFECDGELTIVRKQYHARYNVAEEVTVYEQLNSILQEVSGFRVPQVYESDTEENWMSLEYVGGPHLTDMYTTIGPRAFDETRQSIISLLVHLRRKRFRIDCAPEHFLRDTDSGDWVIIDPVCEEFDLEDFAAVVFLLGMIRCFFRKRPWRWALSFPGTWKRYYRAYVKQSQGTQKAFNQQVSTYIDRVIAWNRQACEEPVHMRILRRTLLVPFWQILQWGFRRNLIG